MAHRPIVILCAMEKEALAIAKETCFSRTSADGVGNIFYSHDLSLYIVFHPADANTGVSCVGTVAAGVLAHASILAIPPLVIINAGTAGGNMRRGARVGDLYFGDKIFFHNRNIPLQGFYEYGIGGYPTADGRELYSKGINAKCGNVSTGDSLTATDEEIARINSFPADVKDMEAAAIAWVCQQLKIPFICLKVITDVFDSEINVNQFSEHFDSACEKLGAATKILVDNIKSNQTLWTK